MLVLAEKLLIKTKDHANIETPVICEYSGWVKPKCSGNIPINPKGIIKKPIYGLISFPLNINMEIHTNNNKIIPERIRPITNVNVYVEIKSNWNLFFNVGPNSTNSEQINAGIKIFADRSSIALAYVAANVSNLFQLLCITYG